MNLIITIDEANYAIPQDDGSLWFPARDVKDMEECFDNFYRYAEDFFDDKASIDDRNIHDLIDRMFDYAGEFISYMEKELLTPLTIEDGLLFTRKKEAEYTELHEKLYNSLKEIEPLLLEYRRSSL